MAQQYSVECIIYLEDIELEAQGIYDPGTPPSGEAGPPENYDPGEGPSFELEDVYLCGESLGPMLQNLYIRKYEKEVPRYVHLWEELEQKALAKAIEDYGTMEDSLPPEDFE